MIARLENPDYGKFSLSTLLKLASAFDVALLIRFVAFGELLERTRDLSPAGLNAASFRDDARLRRIEGITFSTANLSQEPRHIPMPPARPRQIPEDASNLDVVVTYGNEMTHPHVGTRTLQ